MNRRLGLGFVVWLAAVAAQPLAARADEFLDRMLIMDRSGSMWNRLQNGETRFDVADKLAENLVRSMGAAQPDVTVGVVALGHQFPRARHSCDDVQTVVPATKLGSRETIETVARAAGSLPEPKGMTPLTEAVEEAAHSLPQGGSIVIISDFDETCDGDVELSCQAINTLKARGALVGISIRYIVALADLDSALPEMSRYAECTGAKLLRVDSSASAARMAKAISTDLSNLSRTLDLTVAFALDKPTEIAPAWGVPPLDGEVVYSGAGEGKAKIEASSVKLQVRAGPYKVTAHIGGLSGSADINAAAGEDNRIQFTVHTARLSLSAVGPEGEMLTGGDAVWTFKSKTGALTTREGDSVMLDLPPGTYEADVRSSVGGGHLELSLRSGQVLEQPVQLDAALASASEGRVAFAPEIEAPTLFADSGGAPPELALASKSGSITRVLARAAAATVRSGRYDAAIEWRGVRWPIAPIEIAKDQLVEASAKLSPTILDASLRGISDSETVWRITREDGTEASLRGARLRQSLPPGDYTLEVQLKGQSWLKTIRIGFGALEEVIANE